LQKLPGGEKETAGLFTPGKKMIKRQVEMRRGKRRHGKTGKEVTTNGQTPLPKGVTGKRKE